MSTNEQQWISVPGVHSENKSKLEGPGVNRPWICWNRWKPLYIYHEMTQGLPKWNEYNLTSPCDCNPMFYFSSINLIKCIEHETDQLVHESIQESEWILDSHPCREPVSNMDSSTVDRHNLLLQVRSLWH